jgi:hypothetical protein
LAEYAVCVAQWDVDRFVALYADGYSEIDHRVLGWEQARKDDGLVPKWESFLAAGSDWWFEVSAVLACDDRIVAVQCSHHGTANDGGGRFELAYGVVAVIDDGLVSHTERFEYDDRQAMLVRFAELGGGLGRLGDRPSERAVAEWGRRLARRDVDGLLELYTDADFVHLDHRTLGWEDVGNKDGLGRVYESFLAVGSDFWFSVDEVLACDDRVIAFLCSVHGTTNEGGGRFEIAFGRVAVIEAGLYRSIEVYGTDERQAMLVRFAELGGGLGPLGDRPPERWLTEFAVRWPRCDVDRQLELIAADWVLIDHRALGWEELHKDSLRPFWESFFAAGSDWRFVVEEVLACDDRVVAFRCSYQGMNNDGGGPFEIATGAVAVIENGLMSRLEQFEHGDRPAILARFAELGGGQG